MVRRTFIQTAVGAAVAAALPLPALPLPPAVLPAAPLPTPENYWCPCGLVQYFRKPEEKYFVATHILMDGQRQRFTYGLFRRHEELHRKLDIGTGNA
jgi:hypothetical protein